MGTGVVEIVLHEDVNGKMNLWLEDRGMTIDRERKKVENEGGVDVIYCLLARGRHLVDCISRRGDGQLMIKWLIAYLDEENIFD